MATSSSKITTPTTPSYLDIRWTAIQKFEGYRSAIYLDASGYPTVGYGFLLTKGSTVNGNVAASFVSNAPDPVLAQKVLDALTAAGGNKDKLKKSFDLTEDNRLLGLKEGKNEDGTEKVTSISNLLPQANARAVFDIIADTYESRLNNVSAFSALTEVQRSVVFSRTYNGWPGKELAEKIMSSGTPEKVMEFFSQARGGANPGHYERTIEEAKDFLGDKVTEKEVGNAKGFTYTDKDGHEVFIGSQRLLDDKGRMGAAEIVAYKVVTKVDGTQDQELLPLPGLPSSLKIVVNSKLLPLDPAVELNNAIESGNLREIFKAQALNPDNKTPAELLASFKDLNPEIGEKKTFNIGTDKKPRNIEGYEVVDEDGKTTIFATGKDPKTGKVGVVTLEKEAPSETDPEPKLHGVDLLPQQATQHRLKVSDAGDLEGPQYASADAADVLAGMGGHPVVLADTGGGTSDAATTLEEAMARAIVERVERADAWGKALQEEFGEPVNVVANADGTKSIVNDAGEVLGTVKVEHDAVTLARTDGGQISVSEEGQASVQFTPEATSTPLSSFSLNVADIPVPDLVSHFTGVQNPGAYGAGQLAGFDVLPFNENSSFFVNADGDIVAEINHLPNGYSQVKDLGGNTFYFNEKDATVLTQDQYQQTQTQTLTLDLGEIQRTASAIGLMNTIIGLQHWDNMSDLQRTAALASIYNVADQLTGGKALPGDLGTAASALGLLNALDRGDLGSIAYSGLSLVENLTQTVNAAGQVTQAGWVTANMPGGGSFLPGLSFALALDSGDPVSIASSGMALMSSLGWIGPWGMVAGAVISVFGGLFGDDAPDIPTREGLAHAQWDAAGNTVVITDQDIEGGGPTATGWMTSLVDGLQAQLAGMRDASGNPYALVPDLLPAVGFRYDPDGLNLGNGARGFVYLQWTDENGQTQTRYYDGAGKRGDPMRRRTQFIKPRSAMRTIRRTPPDAPNHHRSYAT